MTPEGWINIGMCLVWLAIGLLLGHAWGYWRANRAALQIGRH